MVSVNNEKTKPGLSTVDQVKAYKAWISKMNVPTGISSNSDIVAGKFVMIIGSPKENNEVSNVQLINMKYCYYHICNVM